MPSKARSNRTSASNGAKTRASSGATAAGNANRSSGTATQTAAPRAARPAGSTTPVVKRQPVARRQVRAVRRAEMRRRRNNALTGIAAVLVVGAIVWALMTHMPASGAKGKTTAANASCPSTPTVVGPAPAQTPAPTPPPVTGKTITGDQGLQYIDMSAGCGKTTQNGDTVTVIYTGWLQSNGKEFDSSLSHGGTFQIPSALGSSQPQVIEGWNIGLTGMKVGATRRLIIPPSLGYGAQGSPPVIPPNATLIFDVTIVSIDSSGA